MKCSYVMALLTLASLPLPVPAQQPFILTDGTPLRVRLNRNVSSAEAKIGDPVDFDVVEDVFINGITIIQRGSRALGTVTDAARAGRGKTGRLTVNIDHARSVVGEKIALRAVKEDESGEASGNTSITTLASSIVTAPLSLFVKGKEITIPKGTEVIAYVHGDVRLDEAQFRAAPVNAPKAGVLSAPTPPAPAAQPPPPPSVTSPAPSTPAAPPETVSAEQPAPAPRASGMTNEDVLALRAAGFSDALIVAKINSSRCAFRLDTSDMIELKKAGLSDRVIGAMMDKMN